MKKLLSFILVAIFLFSMAACGTSTESASTDAVQGSSKAEQTSQTAVDSIFNLEGTIFPLEEPVTFTITTSGYRSADVRNIYENEDFINLCEATNVFFEIDYVGDYDAPETKTTLQMKLMNEDYGDCLWSFYLDNLTKDDINELAEAGIVISLDDYLHDASIMPNFVNKILPGHEYLLTNMKSNNGNINAFYGIAQAAGYSSDEGLMQVNEDWLIAWENAKGIDHSPETLDEFEDMLIFFRDNDLNGNGEKDEIAYFIAQATFNGTASLEPAMGMFGIGIKDSAADMDIMISEDGECYYVYTTEAYKEGLKTFSKWYSEDLIWKEIFTANSETIAEMCANAKDSFGIINTCYDLDGFVPLLPPAVEGYEARYHTHPASRLGLDGQPFALITNKCENPEILAAFFDICYDFDNYLIWRYGSKSFEDGRITINESGKYVFDLQKYSNEDNTQSENVGSNPIADYLWYLSAVTDTNLEKVDTESYFGNTVAAKGYKLYSENGLWNPTELLWPRCSIISDKADDYSFMYTDVSTTVAEYRAKFLTGALNVETDWDEFQSKLETLGIKEMQEIIQASYEAYLAK